MFNLPSLQKIYDAFIKDTVRLYKVIPQYLKFRFWAIFILQILIALFETCTIFIITFFALSLTAIDVARNNFIIRTLFSIIPSLEKFCETPRLFIVFVCCMCCLFVVIKNILAIITLRKTTRFSEDVAFYIGKETLQRYLNKSYFWHISPASADIIQKMSHRNSLSSLLVNLLQLYSNIICCIALFTSISIMEPGLTLLIVLVFSLVSLVTFTAIRHQIDYSAHKSTEAKNRESRAIIGITQGIREILMYRQQETFLMRATEAMKDNVRPTAFLVMAHNLPAWLLETAGFFTIFSITIAMIVLGTEMPTIIMTASMLMLTAWRALPAVTRSMNHAVIVRSIRPAAFSCLDLLETFIKEEVEPLPKADPSFQFSENISLQNASFRYPVSHRHSLTNINLSIPKGRRIALIGPSGAGKSTLALLISGLLQPTEGAILLDGKELTPSSRVAYLEKIGFVPQMPLLVEGTIADNIAFSQLGKPYDRTAIEKICHAAAIDFVFDNPMGIDLQLSSGGKNVSGGQAQRISIARALFTNPEIIIFDEATSALDQASENIIKKTIELLPGNVTVIIIAHRLSTIESCDTVYWIENGSVKECGTPDEIIPSYQASTNRQ